MTGVKVVDASALAAILFGEPAGEAVAHRLADARLVAPSLLAFELANVCVVKCRRHPEQSAHLLTALSLRRRLDIAEIAVDHDAVVELASKTRLTAYDAAYL